MSKQIAQIQISKIEKLYIYVTNCRKTLTQMSSEIKSQYPSRKFYILNGGMWNSDGSPCRGLKVNSVLLSATPWGNVFGYGWDNVNDFCMTTDWQKYSNYISCSTLIHNKKKVEIPYDKAQGGTRGRTAIGLSGSELVMYCSQDGSSDAKTPEKLQEELYSLGLDSAIMLDSGGSSMCNFDGAKITGDGRKVHNWIIVIMKEEEKLDTGNKIVESYITKNPCYTSQQKKSKTKMMLHSTGTPGGTATAIRNSMNSANAETSVEFVIDDTGIYQLLPLGVKSWHCGADANNTHIACEICEPIQTRLLDINWTPLYKGNSKNTTWAVTQLQKELQAWGYDPNGIDGSFGPGCDSALRAFQKDNGLTADGSCGPTTKAKLATRKGSYLKYDPNNAEVKAYFDNVYKKAVWLFAETLKKIGGKADEIICHAEGYRKGIASNHADVEHWFPQHGKTMDVFRSDVKAAMNGNEEVEDNVSNNTPDTWAKEAWDKAAKKIGIDGKAILDGTRPKDDITRQELAVVLNRIGLLD